MGRNAKADYESIALQILNEAGGQPVKTRVLFEMAKAKKLLPEDKWGYHNFTRAVRLSPLFNTLKRGTIALAAVAKPSTPGPSPAVAAVGAEPITPDEEFSSDLEASV